MLLATAIAIALHQRRAHNSAEIQRHYLNSILVGSPRSERYIEELTQLAGDQAKERAAELLAELSSIVYRLDPAPLERIATSLRLPEFLLRKASRSYGIRRSRYLWLFAQIPPWGARPEPHIAKLASSPDRMTRFWVLLSAINAERSSAMQLLAAFDSPMTPFEISQLILMLRHGSIVVAYQPMLRSSNANLQRFGLAIVRHFGIESAEQELHEIIAESTDPELRLEALYVTASMQLPLHSPSTTQFVRQMPSLERHRFLRHIATLGYSLQTIKLLTTYHEGEYFSSIINSYKIRIQC